MKITFLTGHLCKERHALLYELALDLGEYGAEVTVITGFPSRRISKNIRDYYLEYPVERVSKNVTVRRVGSRKGEGDGLLVRMFKYLFLTNTIYHEAKKLKTDIYYIYSSPPFLGYIGCKLAKIAPTVYNAQDLFPETLVHMKHLSMKNLIIRWLRQKEISVYKKNTRIVTISNDMKKTIIATGCEADKVDVIWNWADISSLHHVVREKNQIMDELGIDKFKFIVSYAGDIGLFQGWDIILEAAKVLARDYVDISFAIIGSGSFKSRLETRIVEEKIENVQVFPLQPASRLSEIYSVGDIEIIPVEEGITKIALPSKFGVIIASGSPVLAITDLDSDMAKIIDEFQIGISVEYGDVKKLVEAILYCRSDRDKLEKWGRNARMLAESNYSRKKQTKKYYDLLHSLVYSNDLDNSCD